MLNSTSTNVLDYEIDRFPSPFDETLPDVDLTNQTDYDDFILNESPAWNSSNTDLNPLLSIFSASSPFSYIIFVLIVYFVLTVFLLSFSLYKQRRSDLDNFYYAENEDEIQLTKRTWAWKQYLIGQIRKGDMEPLLSDRISAESNRLEQIQLNLSTFPSENVWARSNLRTGFNASRTPVKLEKKNKRLNWQVVLTFRSLLVIFLRRRARRLVLTNKVLLWPSEIELRSHSIIWTFSLERRIVSSQRPWFLFR